MTPNEFSDIADAACVSMGAAHDCIWAGNRLEPRLWEALRVELQRRYRRSTGETMAVLSVENHPQQGIPPVDQTARCPTCDGTGKEARHQLCRDCDEASGALGLEAGRWLPIALADKTITDVEDFSEVGITLSTSDRYWVRDDDGRVYEAAWSEGNNGRDYWWDFEGESPVDPVEFMPHPLDPRFLEAKP